MLNDTQPAATKLLFRLDEACAALGVGRTTLYKLLGDGRLRSVSVNGRRLIHRDVLERFAVSLENDAS